MRPDAPHEFCLYRADLALLLGAGSGRRCINDVEIVHRLTHVLRLRAGEHFTLFDRQIHVDCTLVSTARHQVVVDVAECTHNEIFTPHLTLIIGVLKRDAFQELIMCATRMAVNLIQPIFTAKAQGPWVGPSERERLERLAAAAAGQCKNFAFPDIRSPIAFDEFIKQAADHQGLKLLCDTAGKPIFDVVCAQPSDQNVWVCLGPEGGLTNNERQCLVSVDYQLCRLTRTTLRSVDAAALAAGIIRCA